MVPPVAIARSLPSFDADVMVDAKAVAGGPMHTRLKLRRDAVLAARSELLAGAAERVIDDLRDFAAAGEAPHLAALAVAYGRAIDELRYAIRAGADLRAVLFQFEAVGRDIVAVLTDLQAALASPAKPPPKPSSV